jgi:hypothetical protein
LPDISEMSGKGGWSERYGLVVGAQRLVVAAVRPTRPDGPSRMILIEKSVHLKDETYRLLPDLAS